VRRGATRWVHLDEHLPVLLYYLTAKADDEGRVGFRRDIYNRDKRLIAALDKPADIEERIVFAEPEPSETAPAEGDEGDARVASADDDGREASAGAPESEVEAAGEEGGSAEPLADASEQESAGIAASDAETEAGSPLEVQEQPAPRSAGADEGDAATQASDVADSVEPGETPATDAAPVDVEAAVEPADEDAARPASPAMSSEPLPPSAARHGQLRMDLDAAGRFLGAEEGSAPALSPVRLDLGSRAFSVTIPESAPTARGGTGDALEGDAAPQLNPAVWRLPAD
jgi:hypothetical protein